MSAPQATTPAENPLRPVLIAADLLPQEILEGRRGRVVRRVVIAMFVFFVVGLGGWYGWETYQAGLARAELALVEDDVLRLQRQQTGYAEVVKARADSDAIRAQLEVLLARDLRWSRLLGTVDSLGTDGIRTDTITATLTEPESTPGGEAGQPPPAPTGDEPIGTLVITGTGESAEQVAGYADALASATGVANPLLNSATPVSGNKVQFTLHFDITAKALGGRFTEGAKED
jgi:hypothetical protein